MKTQTEWTPPIRAFSAALALGLTSGAVVAATTQLPNGANLTIEIVEPTDGEEFKVPAASPGGTVQVDATGTASVGEGEPDVALVIVVDVSNTTEFNCGDGLGSILDCEKIAVGNLLSSDNISSVAEFGLAIYGADAKTADMSSSAGDQQLTSNPSDAQTVARSITLELSVTSGDLFGTGKVQEFTLKTVDPIGTNFASGLDAAATILATSTSSTKLVIFLSDGKSNTGGGSFNTDLDRVDDENATIFSFAIGSGSSCTGGSDGTLEDMADKTGGTCTAVPNPADLPTILPDLISTQLLSITVNGMNLLDDSLPTDGPVTVDYAKALQFTPGEHDITATATGSDTSGSDSVSETVTVQVVQLTASPDEETNELGLDNTHTVIAQILGDPAVIAGREIDFEVSVGPNARTTGDCSPNTDCTTDDTGQTRFTYQVPVETDSLGTDTITISASLGGMTDSIDVTKIWEDTTPPEAQCIETTNPHGQNTPKAPGQGQQGQNQDGFYQLLAKDDVSGADELEVFVRDSGSITTFGPFAVGDNIKYTEDAEASPLLKKIGSSKGQAGAVTAHIIGNGDAELLAVDSSGNISAAVSCLVPPPPQ